jgi:hypothetical protein
LFATRSAAFSAAAGAAFLLLSRPEITDGHWRLEKKGGATMESVFLTVKFGLFLAMELVVVGVLVGALIAGLYQIVRDKVRESRLLDQVSQEPHPVHKQT